MIADDGEPVIDLRGKTARTSLPFSAGALATLPEKREQDAAIWIWSWCRVRRSEWRWVRRSRPECWVSRRPLEAERQAHRPRVLRMGLSFLQPSPLNHLALPIDFWARTDGFDSLDSSGADGFGFLEAAARRSFEDDVGFFWRFASGGVRVFVLRELSESSLIRDFGRDGSVGVARVSRFEEREFEGAGRLSSCDSLAVRL